MSSFFSICSWQAIAEMSCRACPQEIRVSCRGMAVHECPLLSDICWFTISRIRSDDEFGVTDLPSGYDVVCDIASSETHEKPYPSACFPASAII